MSTLQNDNLWYKTLSSEEEGGGRGGEGGMEPSEESSSHCWMVQRAKGLGNQKSRVTSHPSPGESLEGWSFVKQGNITELQGSEVTYFCVIEDPS